MAKFQIYIFQIIVTSKPASFLYPLLCASFVRQVSCLRSKNSFPFQFPSWLWFGQQKETTALNRKQLIFMKIRGKKRKPFLITKFFHETITLKEEKNTKTNQITKFTSKPNWIQIKIQRNLQGDPSNSLKGPIRSMQPGLMQRMQIYASCSSWTCFSGISQFAQLRWWEAAVNIWRLPDLHRPSCRSSENTAVRKVLSLSMPLSPEKGPDENMEEVASDSYVVDDCLTLGLLEVVIRESWYSTTRWTIFRDWTTSPIVGRWLASGETQAVAIVQTRIKSSLGYLPASFGSARSSRWSLFLRMGRACHNKLDKQSS